MFVIPDSDDLVKTNVLMYLCAVAAGSGAGGHMPRPPAEGPKAGSVIFSNMKYTKILCALLRPE